MRWFLTAVLLCVLALPAAALTTHGQGSESVEREAVLGDFASGFVAQGCLPTIVQPGTLRQVVLPPCRAYALDTGGDLRRLRYVQETEPLTLTTAAPDGFAWIAMRATVETTPAGWTGVPGRHYLWTTSTATRPVLPSGTLLLAALVLKTGAITQVADLRPDTPYRGPINALSPLYGVTGDCTTVDTAGLQAVFNAGQWRDREVYLPSPPGGCYKTGPLWLNYEAAGNPGAPQDVQNQGYLLVQGDGPMRFKTATGPRTYERTVLECVDTTQPCIRAYAPMGAGASNALRQVRLERLSIIGDTPGQYLVNIDGANNAAGLREVYVLQKSQTGHGVNWRNTFIVDFTQVFIEYQPQTPGGRSSGVGLFLANNSGAGGMVDARNVSAKGFDTCWQIGEPVFNEGTRFQSIMILAGQAGSCKTGMWVAHAVRGFTCTGCYFEGIADYGMVFDAGPIGGRVDSSWFAIDEFDAYTDAGILVGHGVAGLGGRAQSLTLSNNVFLGNKYGYGVFIDTSAVLNSVSVANNYFAGGAAPVSTVGVGCRSTSFDPNGLSATDNFFTPEVLTPVEVACYNTGVVTGLDRVSLGRTVSFHSGTAIASAPTITIPTNGNTFNITGAAAVTTISCPQCLSGAQLRFIRVPGNDFTFAEGGNMNLSSANANAWTPTGHSILTLELYSTTWYEVGRTTN